LKRFVFLPFIVLLLASPVRDARVFGSIDHVPTPAVAAEAPPLRSVEAYKDLLKTRGQNLDDQGILVQSLDAKATLAEHNADIAFNPASVMKLATTLTALAKFGPDYRYRTNFLADGAVDASAHKLNGDLVVEGATDPMFSAQDAQEVAAELGKLGISHVTGALRITGPFYYFATGYHSNLSRETSAAKLRTALQAAGIRIEGQTVFGDRAGAVLLSHYSDPLINILFYQNAHSSNAIAEVVGESVGGPQAVQAFLTRQVGIRDSEIYVGRTSGLEFNRITPRAALQVLRSLIGLLANYSLKPEDVMPVAGVDSGTLRTRFVSDAARGAVVAKTGTLVSLDNGVSTLVGIAYTKTRGPLLFAILNSDGGVHSYRRLQDDFVEQLIAEEGGPAPVARTEDALADATRHTIVQVLYNPRAQASTPPAAD
jgi:D-alanyl-D-alanine carboxypeptidase/D-alanyl-D-alanine-endopeptidase (penicillin-binding protein 4)